METVSDWCRSEDDLPRPKIKGKTRFHKIRSTPKKCECKNYNCQCGPDPALEAIEDEKDKEVKIVSLKFKPTNASVLRDASILLKEDQKQQQKILELLSAPRSYLDYEKYLNELRETQEKEALLELEKKHLNGQLSYEEAILAKKRVLEENSRKREEYLEEKGVMEAELQAFREQELSKVKAMIKDVQQQQEKAKVMQQMVLKTRQKAARAMSRDLKEMMQKRMKEREMEIEKKIAAIRELKILQQIKKEELNSREEKMIKLVGVSMEELKARLKVYKRHLREELMKKKSKIKRQKCRTEMIKTAAVNFIKEVKNCRREKRNMENGGQGSSVDNYVSSWSDKNSRTQPEQRVEDEQLTILRAKLEQARMKRQSFQSRNRKSLAT
ncbi:hypothetical protein GE061_006038 [Apolygus lucorum]|uniref:Uncharacterized protein n=1 Tax=Apolygus lucorum TaxID=248454 RepID=A0A8S9WS30_APOLU|nr:hypothetical protein GE061_006038 [Apolygus lucorum]